MTTPDCSAACAHGFGLGSCVFRDCPNQGHSTGSGAVIRAAAATCPWCKHAPHEDACKCGCPPLSRVSVTERRAAATRRSRRVHSWEATALALQRERDALVDENERLAAENERLASEAARLQDGINQLIRAKVEGTL